MTRVKHIIGPPGTGKTTKIAAGARRAAEHYGADKVLIVSLTRAAAREAAGRDLPIPRHHIGTLHSICYHALDRPALIAPDHVREWNALHPQWKLPLDIVTGEDDGSARDSIFAEYTIRRQRMDDRRMWRDGLRAFATAFEDFKGSADLHDFTDLIELAALNLPFAPGRPALIAADEYQDFSRLEASLVSRWGQHAEDLVLVGDPLQSIYDWRGADPAIFDDEFAEREILCETMPSYRCPRAVWRRATALASELLARERVAYLPRDAEGVVSSGPPLDRWVPDGEPGMLLAPCEYMLAPLIKRLRSLGLPYHNPFNKRWNPLRRKGTLGALLAVTTTDVAFTLDEMRAFAPHLVADCYRGTKKAALDALPSEGPWSLADANLWASTHLQPGAVDGLLGCVDIGDPSWYVENATETFQRYADYPAAAVQNVGARELRRQLDTAPRRRPWWSVGTVHSVKGGESNRVFVWPALSPSQYEQSRLPGWHGREALTRLFYVALTRAREELVVGAAGGLRFPV